MSRNKMRKLPSERGAGKIERSKSGGAVRGKIPKAGGYNRTNHETGVTVSKYGKDKPKGKALTKLKRHVGTIPLMMKKTTGD